MPKAKDRDGVFTRKDRPGKFFGSWTDASGRRRKRKLEAHTLTQARKLLNAEKARVDKQRTLGYAPPTKDSFGSIITRYLKYQKPRLSAVSYVRTSGIIEKQLRPVFGSLRLADIKRMDIQHYVTERASEISPGSVVKELNVLKHLLGLAVEWELIHFNPALKIKSPRVPAGRVRYLQPTELRALITACPEWLRGIVALAAFTAMRRGEILSLRWLNVDLKGSRLMLSQTKNGEGRIVYLNTLAADVIKSQLRDGVKPIDKVFPQTDNFTPDNVSKGFATVCKNLELHDFHFHDLRHTAASWMRMQGADVHTIAQLLGHKDLRMATRYQHLSPDFLGAAVRHLDAVFGEVPQLPTDTTDEAVNSKES